MSEIVALFALDQRPVERTHLLSMTEAVGCAGRETILLGGSLPIPASLGLGQVEREGAREYSLPSISTELTVVGKIRIDNRQDLCHRLAIPVAQAAGLSDTQLVAMAYQRWGEGCGRFLVGLFAVVVWESRRRRLVCIHDPMGDAGLFYYHGGGLLAISTSSKALLALPGVSGALNLARVAEFLVLSGGPEATFRESIRRLRPGHTLTVSRGRLRQQSYWSPLAGPSVRLKSDRDYLERFRELLGEAVASQLHGSTRVGVMLSGGLDSSAVAALAASQLAGDGRRVSTFTSVPPRGFDNTAPNGSYYDETPYVDAIARLHSNIDAHYVRDGFGELPFLSGDLMSRDDAPPLNPDGVPWVKAIGHIAAAQGIDTLLTGQTGNFTISYSGGALLPWFAITGHWGRLGHELTCLADRSGCSRWQVAKTHVLKPLLPDWVAGLYHWRGQGAPVTPSWRDFSVINPRFANRHIDRGEVILSRWRQLSSRHARTSGMLAGLYFDQMETMSVWFARLGLELRDPARDRRVVEFCLSIPDDQYFRDGRGRRLVRQGMQGLLPAMVTGNRLRGVQRPDWFSVMSAARPGIDDLMRRLERSDLARECLDVPRMRKLIEHWPGGDDWQRTSVMEEYRCALQRGLSMGRFLLLNE